MRRYEVMVILDPELEERTVELSLDTYLNIVPRKVARSRVLTLGPLQAGL